MKPRRWFGPVAALALLATAMPAAARAPGEAVTYVWEVSAPGGAPGKDYLLGTMHMPLPSGQRIPAAVDAYLARSKSFYMEVDFSQVTPAIMARYTMLPEGQDLEAMLPPAAWAKAKAAGARQQLDEASLRRFKPWFLSLTISLEGAAPEGGAVMDQLLHNRARAQAKRIGYLETAEEQFGILDSVSDDEDMKQFLEVLESPEKSRAELATLKKLYRAGDTRGLTAKLFEPESVREAPDFYDKIFHQRNAKWLPKLETIFAQEDAFVAVGLGHLVGETGVLKMLQAKGYGIKQVAP